MPADPPIPHGGGHHLLPLEGDRVPPYLAGRIPDDPAVAGQPCEFGVDFDNDEVSPPEHA